MYDVAARRTVVTNSLGYATTYQGNENGLVVKLQDARGGVTRTEYNEYNELLKETDSLGATTTYAYDERGHCELTTLPNGAAVQREFDDQGRLLTLLDVVGGNWQWHHNPADTVTTRINPAGKEACIQYENGLVGRFTDESKRMVAYRYDGAGNLVEQYANGVVQQRQLYDQWGCVHAAMDKFRIHSVH